jgi:hypothetical protein
MYRRFRILSYCYPLQTSKVVRASVPAVIRVIAHT